MPQLLERPGTSRNHRTNPIDAAEQVAFELVSGRRNAASESGTWRRATIRGFPVPMPANDESFAPTLPPRMFVPAHKFLDPNDRHSEMRVARVLPKPLVTQMQFNDDPASGGYASSATATYLDALKADASICYTQIRETLSFLPEWAWSRTALSAYALLATGAFIGLVTMVANQ